MEGTEEPPKKKSLSKNLRSMKFMQRQHEADLRKKLEDEQRNQLSASHWVVEGLEADAFPSVSVMNESTFDFSVGRRSFQSFNPTVEKLDKKASGTKDEDVKTSKNTKRNVHKKKRREEDADISSTQMAKKLTSFKRKREQMDPPTY